ncbi:cytidine deaminase [Rhodococcus sp. NPDC049939]|uniref:cytidine deaminase n=1 Tax=Rhodococcus sp. NPDC049939 TaxID=3155511 RepID=UPI0033DE3EC9
MVEIDWKLLRDNARDAVRRAYAPYSGFTVGSAALVDDGRIVVGCNVENVSHGLGLCSECVLVGNFMVGGGGRLVAITCCGASGEILTPCGRCRQILFEHGGPGLLVDHKAGARRMEQLLPDAFGPEEEDRLRHA